MVVIIEGLVTSLYNISPDTANTFGGLLCSPGCTCKQNEKNNIFVHINDEICYIWPDHKNIPWKFHEWVFLMKHLWKDVQYTKCNISYMTSLAKTCYVRTTTEFNLLSQPTDTLNSYPSPVYKC